MHPLSHNLPMDTNEYWCNPGTTCAMVADSGNSGIGRYPWCVDFIVCPFGLLMDIGQTDGCTLIKFALVAKKFPELPVSGTILLLGGVTVDINKQLFFCLSLSTTPHHQNCPFCGKCVLCASFQLPPIGFSLVAI